MSVTVCRRSSAQDFLRDAVWVRIGSSMSALGRTAARLDLQTCRYGTSDSRGTALIEFDFKKARAALSASLLAPGPSITSLIGSTAVGNAAGSEDAGTTPSGNAMYGTSAALVGRKRIGWIRFVLSLSGEIGRTSLHSLSWWKARCLRSPASLRILFLASSKYPPAEPVALRLLAPQRGLFATVRSKSKNKSKSLVLLSSLPQHRQFEGEHTPGILKVLLPPRQSRGISLLN